MMDVLTKEVDLTKAIDLSAIGNNLNDTDSYKFGHFRMAMPNTERTYSYFECRDGAKFKMAKMFGLQYILHQLAKEFTMDELEELFELSQQHGVPVNYEGMKELFDAHGGRLPIEIRAIAEGELIPVSNALITIENTDSRFEWLTNYVETMISRVWYPITIATLSYNIKIMIKGFLNETSDDNGILSYDLHDFGARGTTCREQAMIGGAAHLTNFYGTDTSVGMFMLKKVYGAQKAAGYSVYATEHKIMTQLSEEGEKQVIEFLLNQVPDGFLAMVIDSYDYRRFISIYANEFKEKILARNGKVVFRPDSGDPVEVSLDVFNRLWDVFGGTINSKGYKVLNPKVGMLWGDGIDMDGMREVLTAFKNNGISTCNIVFGSGGGLLQKVNRDTMRCAFKCSAQYRDGKWVDIFKNPIDGTKTSKKGRLGVIRENGTIITINQNDPRYSPDKDLLIPVFRDGKILKAYALDEIRAKSW